jgi:hypothetical protein
MSVKFHASRRDRFCLDFLCITQLRMIVFFLLVKVINFTHSQQMKKNGYVGPLDIFTDHAQLMDHASQRLSHVCGFLLLVTVCFFSSSSTHCPEVKAMSLLYNSLMAMKYTLHHLSCIR